QLGEAAQSLFGRTLFVQLLQQQPQSRNAEVDNGVGNLLLRLEVVVEIAQRNPGLLRNVSKSHGVEPVAMGDLHGGLKEPRPIVHFRFWHYSILDYPGLYTTMFVLQLTRMRHEMPAL